MSYPGNVSSILTTSCSIGNAEDSILLAPQETYTETIYNQKTSINTDITILGSAGELDNNIRIILGGSSIMFSDQANTITNTSWYESADNSILWLNLFEWLRESSTVDQSIPISMEQIIIIIGIITTIAVVFLLSGSFLFSIGSSKKIEILKSEEIIPITPKTKSKEPKAIKVEKPGSPHPSPPPKQTKRDRRLQQIKKTTRKKKK